MCINITAYERAGNRWRDRASETGWILLPLRLFLGFTMVYAGLIKLFDPTYLDPTSTSGVHSQMLAAATGSPISVIVSFAAERATAFGLAIAFGELAVGIGIFLGLWTRIAALGGMLLSLSFFLTVSWGTTPYFFGPDIVFIFAFTPLVIGGDAGVMSLPAAIRGAAIRKARRASISMMSSREVTEFVNRRTVLGTALAAGAVAGGALLLGGIGRIFASSSSASPASQGAADVTSSATGQSIASQSNQTGAGPPGGVRIASAAHVPVGGVKAFTDPHTNEPAYLLQPVLGTFLAYSAGCPHEGCTVGFDQSRDQFACPCHGARFDGASGNVIRGPARRPLRKINVVAVKGIIYSV